MNSIVVRKSKNKKETGKINLKNNNNIYNIVYLIEVQVCFKLTKERIFLRKL